IDGRVLLGCLLDAAGRVLDWLEVWIQDVDALASSPAACRESLTNAALDERWASCFDGMMAAEPACVIQTGWEKAHPLPMYIDLSSMEPLHPQDEQSGQRWQLCQDDALLADRKLPTYCGSLHRYLYLPQLGRDSPLVAASAEAPRGEGVLSPAELAGGRRGLLAVNPAGGLVILRRHCPIDLESFSDVLSGGGWDGVFHGRELLDLGATFEALKNTDPNLSDGGWLFLGRHGRAGRLVECLHLKLRLLADAVRCVRRVVEATQRPLLNLSAESFQVDLAPPASGLPFLWTARAVLCQAGGALALPIETSDARYFVPAGSQGASVYRPDSAGPSPRGRGTARIRQVLPDAGGATIVEGTFATQERFNVARYDLLWLRLELACGRVDLYGQVEQTSALAAGEWRFRTIAQRFGQDVVSALRSAEGVPISETPFEIVPLLSTPCDLYSLAVLASRLLLVNAQTTLPVAMDELLSLARQLAEDYDESVPLGRRIGNPFEADRRWATSLGPHRLSHEEMTPDEAFDLVPAEVWFDTLAVVVRMLPGIGPDSIARDYGDAPPGGIHKVLDAPAEQLANLLLRTRSLVVIDWRFNREIHAVVRRHLVGLDLPARENQPGGGGD
ncbi:MAG: hypothetical protein J7M21_00805, partial [Planctomycetes bacterium]|nr:hypothetical protein [Planctomycetota bacterium]